MSPSFIFHPLHLLFFQAAQQELESSAEVAGRAHQAARLDAKLLEVEEEVDVGSKIVGDILSDLLASVVGEDKASSGERESQEKEGEKEEVAGEQREERRRERRGRETVPVAVVEIDCTSPDITVRREGKRGGGEEGEERSEECSSCTVEGGEEGRRRSSRSLRAGEDSRSGKRSSLRRRGGKRTVRSGKDARARFKSSEDLIHRLYVCISGAADQLQTNFAGDFRSILKYVFLMNSTPDEEEEEEEESPEEEEEEEEEQSPESLSLNEGGEEGEGGEGATGRDSTTPPGQGGRRGYSLGEDALMSETEQSYLRTFPEPTTGEGDGGIHTRLLSTSPPAGLAAMPVYASNLGEHFLQVIRAFKLKKEFSCNWEAIPAVNASRLNSINHSGYHLGEEQGGLGTGGEEGEVYYQPEPTLLTIASGEQGVVEEQVASSRKFCQT